MVYFTRLSECRFAPTDAVVGAWSTDEQHVAPSFGLLAHLVEADRDHRRPDRLPLARLSFDILGIMRMAPIEASITVLRPGRTIELVEAVLSQDGRAAVRLRAWLMVHADTSALAASPLDRILGPSACQPYDPTRTWPGGCVASVEVRRDHDEPGRARFWARTQVPLLDSEPVSRFAAQIGLLDFANGMAVRAHPNEVAFPNVDLTAHFFGEPEGEWLGFDTRVSFGSNGLGVTATVLHDQTGPIGTMSQMLTVRPK